VPAPFVLQEDLGRLVPVQAAATPAQYASLGRAGRVLRDTGYVGGGAGTDFTLVALPPATLAAIDGWRHDFSAQTPGELARLLAPPSVPRLDGRPPPRPAACRQRRAAAVRRLDRHRRRARPRHDGALPPQPRGRLLPAPARAARGSPRARGRVACRRMGGGPRRPRDAPRR